MVDTSALVLGEQYKQIELDDENPTIIALFLPEKYTWR
jgi:hypothetical protein